MKTKIKEVLKSAEEKAKSQGVLLDVYEDDLIDDDHLDCFWYDGWIATARYENFAIHIEVRGDVSMNLLDADGNEVVEYKKTLHGADLASKLSDVIKDDEELYMLEENGLLHWSNNNWIEYFIEERIDAGFQSGIVDSLVYGSNNVLKAVTDVDFIAKTLKHYAEKNN